jgi:hypothetical protein
LKKKVFEIFRSDFRKYFYGVFGLLRQRNGQKTRLKKIGGRREKSTGKKFFSPQLFWPKVFDMDFPKKVFNGVFELPLLRNAQQCHKQTSKKRKKKRRCHGTPFSGYLPDARRSQKKSS